MCSEEFPVGRCGLYNDKDLFQLINQIREETERLTGWDQLRMFLIKIGQVGKAEQVYHILLEKATEEIEKARSYCQIGWAKNCQGEYKQAIVFSQKALKIRQQLLPQNHPNLAMSYNNIGLIYEKTGNLSKAHAFFQGAVDIGEELLSSNHPELQKWRLQLDRIKNNYNQYFSFYSKEK